VCVYHVVYYQQLHAGLPASGQQASVPQASGPQAHPTASEPEAPSQPQAASGPPRPSHWQPQLRLRLGVTGSGSSIWIQHNTLMARKHVERGLIFLITSSRACLSMQRCQLRLWSVYDPGVDA